MLPPATGVHAVLAREEWRLVCALRDLSPGPLRDRLTALIDELVDFVGEPQCPEAQADGVPCETARMACDQCQQVMALFEMLRTGIRRSQGAA